MAIFNYEPELAFYEKRVRTQLSDSLDYIYQQTAKNLTITQQSVEELCAEIERHQLLPSVFALYLQIVEAANSSDLAAIDQLYLRLATEVRVVAEFSIEPLSEESLGSDVSYFKDIWFGDYLGSNPVTPPGKNDFLKTRRDLNDAMLLIYQLDPTIHHEIKTLWTRIYVAENNIDESGRVFGGVTSFILWGASLMNRCQYNSFMLAAEYLVHEITHGVLFALSCDDPLVQNRLEERYKSPLRSEKRPMDGVYHATLVSARLADFYDRWLACGNFEKENSPILEERRKRYIDNFNNSIKVIEENALLNELGRTLFEQSARVIKGLH